MGKKIDMTGWIMSKHGVPESRWTVLYELSEKASNRGIIWHCKCDCGTERDIDGYLLRSGRSKSCGCLHKEIVKKIMTKDIPLGTKFGKLTVIKKLDKKDSHGSYYWHCKCDCGNEIDVVGTSLRNGATKSCGCLKNEILIKNGEKTRYLLENDLTGQDFGLWHVESRAENNESGVVMWNCTCKCGTKKIVQGNTLRNGSSQSCGCTSFSKGENKIKEILEKNNILFEQQKTFKDCLFPDTNYHAYFDFYVDNKYIIEFDGKQHFKFTGGWNTEENLIKTQEHDKIKNQYCKEHNIPIIRIPYTYLKDICLENLLLETSQFIIN